MLQLVLNEYKNRGNGNEQLIGHTQVSPPRNKYDSSHELYIKLTQPLSWILMDFSV
jgi:hypothetical protein